MPLVHAHALLAVAVGAGLLSVWIVGGFAAALVGAALADLALTIVERRRLRRTATAQVSRES